MTQPHLLWIVTVLYAGQAMISAVQGQFAHVLILSGYTIANIGLIWSMQR